MAKLIISDGIGLVNVSRRQARLLGRPYVAFDLSRVIAVSRVPVPKRQELGQRTTPGFKISKTGGYTRGVKRIIYIKGSADQAVRILLLNPNFDEVYLQLNSALEQFEELAKNVKNAALNLAEN